MQTTRGVREDADQIDQIIEEYRLWLLSWASERTTESRVALAKARLHEWGIDGVTARNITEFLGRPTPAGKPKSRWSKATYHSHLTDLCKWLVAADYIEDNPMEEVRSVKRPHPKPNPLSEADATRVLSIARGEVRDWILLAMLAGLRVSEIAKIRGEDFTDESLSVLGKGDETTVLPLHEELLEMRDRYPRRGYWFPGNVAGHVPSQRISRTVGDLFHELGLTGSIHRCRHSYATTLLRQGVHVRRVQKLMRHARLETTATYTAVDEDEMRAAINLLPRLTPVIPPPSSAA